MSADVGSGEGGIMSSYCASCGVKEGDGNDVKLKNCAACHLVKYCGVTIECQKEHRPKHKRECKRRAAELHDEILFKQPESSHTGDCPICFLPLSLMKEKSTIATCCSKVICIGCSYATEQVNFNELKCPFCRTPVPKTELESRKKLKEKAEQMNDSFAMLQYGCMLKHQDGDYKTAFKYLSKATEMGNVDAHHDLAVSYYQGDGVEKDEAKAVYHWEQAAIGGHPVARHNLGVVDWANDRCERAVKHFIIAAYLGYDDSLKQLTDCYKAGHVSKDDLSAALRAHQAAVDATKSPKREEAEEFWRQKESKE